MIVTIRDKPLQQMLARGAKDKKCDVNTYANSLLKAVYELLLDELVRTTQYDDLGGQGD